MKGLKKWTVGLLSAAMLFSAVPAAFSQPTAPVEGQVTADKDFVRDQTGAPLKNEDGSYTIQLSVQGVPYEELQNANADVVLVVDNSGSMASSVGEKCTTTKDKFQEKSRETVLLAWTAITYECPNCHANYTKVIGNLSGETWYENIPNVCTGEKGNEARIDTAKAVGKEFADKLLLTDGQATGNRLAVIGFASEQKDGGANDTGAIKVKQALTVDLAAINTAIDKMKANGGTNYSAALQQAVTWLNGRTGEDAKRPAYVIFVSDGAPGRSGESINDPNWNGSTQVTALKNNNVTIYTVGIVLDDAASQYLKSLASAAQDDHYINVTSTNYKEELQKKLGEWAAQIKSIPAGKNAVMTDVINTADFDLTTTSLPEGVALGTDGKTLTWTIGDIPETAKTIAFQVKPKDGKYGELFTNETVSLTYQNSKTNQGVEVGRDAIENPRLSVTVPHPQITHTLTYDANGGAWEGTFNGVDSQTVAAGSYEFTVKDNVPTRDGYDFLGWADQATATAGQYAAGAKITVSGSKTIYAVWGNTPTPMVQTIHVNFVDADGSTSLQQDDIKSTDPATTLLTPPTVTAPAGKEFAGWKVLVGDQPIYTGAYNFTSLCALVGDNWTAEGEAWLTFAATYQDATPEEQVLTVKFDANGGSWTDSVPATNLKEFVLRSTTPTAELNAPAVNAPEGKEFVRWEMQEGTMLLDAEAVFTYNGVAYYAINGNTNFTFKAVYQDATSEDTTYTVTFDSQGGSKVAGQTVRENGTATKPADPSRSGYTFAGWYTEAACKNAYDFKTPVTKDITLYADWNRNSSGSGENNNSYVITASASGSGKISPSGECYVGEGFDKTFTMTPNRGYEIVKLIIDGDEVRIKDEYTFENVRKDHTIQVVFAKDSEKVESPDNTGVSDSLNTKDHMQYLYGYPDNTFRANQNMTRAEAAQMFFNLLNNKDVKITVHFSDVKNNQWYAQAVNTMATLGIVTGYPDGTFQPNGNITRAEFTAMAMRFGKLDTNGKNIFSDVQSSDWFYHEVVGSSQYGWINGYPDGTFKPNATITRAEVTSMVNNMLGRFADKSYVDKNAGKLNAFTDLTSGHWAYYDIREATNSHDYQKSNNEETWTKLVD